jgi:uncharacterized protein VirK/YbjX
MIDKMYESQKVLPDIISRELKEKEPNQVKIEKYRNALSNLERNIPLKTRLLEALATLKDNSKHPTREYLKHRFSLARRFNAFPELFDCANEKIATETINELYANGSDKLVETLEAAL